MTTNPQDGTPDVLNSAQAGGLVIRGSVLRVAGHGVGVLALSVASVLLLRHLGVVRFGEYVTVMAIVAVASTVADAGLAVVGSRELTLRDVGAPRRRLLGNILGLRLVIAPLGVAGGVVFAMLAGYPDYMVVGALLAGAGLMLTTWQSSWVLMPVVELRNGRVTAVEVAKQLSTVVGIAVLVAAGALLTPFFAVPIAVGLLIVALSPALLGRGALAAPHFDRDVWRRLVREALPVAASYVLATLYLRLVVVLMSLIASGYQTGLFGTSLRIVETLIQIPTLLAGIALPLLTAAARDDHRGCGTRCSGSPRSGSSVADSWSSSPRSPRRRSWSCSAATSSVRPPTSCDPGRRPAWHFPVAVLERGADRAAPPA